MIDELLNCLVVDDRELCDAHRLESFLDILANATALVPYQAEGEKPWGSVGRRVGGVSDVQRDLDPSSLVATIEENTIESILSWTKWSKLQLHQDPDVLWTSSEIPYFIFNMVLNVSPTADPLAVIEKSKEA